MKVSINKFLENPELNSDDFSNFYDWFCSDKALKGRMLALVPKLRFLVKEGIIDGDTHYVYFKNNCPVMGTLYDDIRISNLNGDFLGGFCPKSGHDVENKCNVWTVDSINKFTNREFKNWSEFKKEVKANETLRNELTSHFTA